MKQLKRTLGGLVCAAVLGLSPLAAVAQSHLDTPLLVLRFNQERIPYQQSLYTALSRALQAKPSVVFNIITLIPQAGNAEAGQQSTIAAQTNTNTVVRDMINMGIPQNRIQVSYQHAGGIEASEMHLFVQ